MPLIAVVLVLLPVLMQTTGSPDSQLRTVTFTVIRGDAAPLADLSVDELEVTENGIRRPPIRLEPENGPVTVAVLVDSSETSATFLRLFVVDAVRSFLAGLPEGSRFALWTTGDRPTKLLALTSDVAEATKVLWRIPPRGGNRLLDTLVEASRDLGRTGGTRRTVVAITGSGLGFGNYDRRRVVDLAVESAAVFWSVRLNEGATFAGGDFGAVDYDYVLSALAQRTGGCARVTLSPMGVARALGDIAAEMRSQYRLTYRTGVSSTTPKIDVRITRPGLKARVASVMIPSH